MAINPLDFLKNLVPDNTNIFGASPPEFSQRAKELGLLEEDALKKANRQSIFSGLLNTGLTLAANPMNKGYGSIIPYLAQAYGSGVQAAQNPYTQLGKDMQYKQQFDEYERKKQIENLQKNIYDPATTIQVKPSAISKLAPIDASNPAGLAIAPNFSTTGTTVNVPRQINEEKLQKLAGLDVNAAANLLKVDDAFQSREDLELAKKSIKEFTTKYPQYSYLDKQPVTAAMTTIRSLTGPSRFKTVDNRYLIDTLDNETRDLAKTFPELKNNRQQRGTFQEKGQLLNPMAGKSYPISMNTATNEYTVKYRGKDVPLKDFDTIENGGKALFGKGVSPKTFTTGNLSKGMISGENMIKLSSNLTKNEESYQSLTRFLVRNANMPTGFKKVANSLITDLKTITSIAENNDLTAEQIIQKVQEGSFEALAGKNRLSIVGPGAMTEQDAARLYRALGGLPASLRTNPQAVEMLVSEILRDSYTNYKETLAMYNIQKMSGHAAYPDKPEIKLSKKQLNSISPSVVVSLGLGEFKDLTPKQLSTYDNLKSINDFDAQMKQLNVDEAREIFKKIDSYNNRANTSKFQKDFKQKNATQNPNIIINKDPVDIIYNEAMTQS